MPLRTGWWLLGQGWGGEGAPKGTGKHLRAAGRLAASGLGIAGPLRCGPLRCAHLPALPPVPRTAQALTLRKAAERKKRPAAPVSPQTTALCSRRARRLPRLPPLLGLTSPSPRPRPRRPASPPAGAPLSWAPWHWAPPGGSRPAPRRLLRPAPTLSLPGGPLGARTFASSLCGPVSAGTSAVFSPPSRRLSPVWVSDAGQLTTGCQHTSARAAPQGPPPASLQP